MVLDACRRGPFKLQHFAHSCVLRPINAQDPQPPPSGHCPAVPAKAAEFCECRNATSRGRGDFPALLRLGAPVA